MVARERASEGCFASWRRRSLPRIMVYASQLHARSRPYHRAEYPIIALPEEKPVDTNKTGDMHMATQIVLFVSGRTTDVSRRKLHSASRHPCSSTCHHSWCTTFTCTSCDVLGTVSCILCGSSCCCSRCDQRGRGTNG